MTIEDIKTKIKQDKERKSGSYCRYPVRFIFMDANANTADELADLVSSFDGNLVCLNDFLTSEDGWITKTSLMSVVKDCPKKQDSFIVGFSELVRFYSSKELESLLLTFVGDIENDLADECQKHRRLYFICFSMKEYLQQIICDKFRRLDVYNPFINAEFDYSLSNKELLFVNNDLKVKSGKNIISTSKEWLSLWKNAALLDYSKPILCLSPNLFAWYKKVFPDNAFQIEIIMNYKELINKMCSFNVPFQYKDVDAVKWQALYQLVAEKGIEASLDSVAQELCNVKSLDSVSSFICWFTTDDKFKKWYMSEYIKYTYSFSLLGNLFTSHLCDRNADILGALVKYPFEGGKADFFQERKELLHAVSRYISDDDGRKQIQDGIDYSLQQELDGKDTLSYFDFWNPKISICKDENLSDVLKNYVKKLFLPAFTGIFSSEKEMLIRLVAETIVSIDEAKGYYAPLYYYLASVKAGNDEFADKYLAEYRKSKAVGKDTEDLLQMLECNESEHSFSEWYYKYNTQSELIKKAGCKDVYIIDGLGGEYLPVILNALKENGYKAKMAEYAVAHIPSITSVNKKYISDACDYTEWIDDFDRKVIHGDYYQNSRNLRKAFDNIEKIINRIVSTQDGAPFVLTADHGATARGKWNENAKKYNFDKADHEGRCVLVDDDSLASTSDYIRYKDQELGKTWLTCLRDISLYNNPKYEDHGGVTPEELFVPFILAVKADEIFVDYQIELVSNKITGLDKIVRFMISPKPINAYVVDGAGEKKVLEEEGGNWIAELTTGESQTVKVYADECVAEFKVINAGASNMAREDDGFDDFD